MPVLSLIIPVYNVEPYLAECLDSCINQTFTDIEIICVNDCSPDKSGEILNEYAKKDSRVKIITHKENKGLGGARNTGIEVATGDYCWFIDSDDYIILNACEILNDIIREFKTDVIRFNRINYNFDISTGNKVILPQQNYSWTANRLFTKADYTKLNMPEVSACMYITSIILLRKVKFREGVIHEDNDFTPILFSKSETIYNANYSLYCVRRRLESITNNGIIGLSPRSVNDVLLAIDTLYKYIASEMLSKYHFCTRTATGLCKYAKQEYEKYPEIHSKELDNIINNAESLGTIYSGLLDFILRVYRFVIKRIKREFN